MADQYLAIVEETTRGTDPTTGYLFPAVTSSLQPQFNPEDEARNEFRGQSSGLGNTSASVVRRSSQWTYTLEMPFYPGPEVNLLFKHLFGFAGTRTVVDTSAYGGIFYPLTQPYGTGRNLADKAIGIIPNTDVEGTTKSQYFGGGRVRSCTISGEGTDDIMLSFEIVGPGEYIGTQTTATAGASFTTVSPYVASDILMYIGAGISRTGTAPDFTAIAKGSMPQFCPDSFSITITNNLDDKVVFCGVQGPSKTTRTGQFTVEASFPIDLEDPDGEFSSLDEYNNLFTDVATNSILILGDNGELAGAATENYNFALDLAGLVNKTPAYEVNSEGQTPSIELTYSSLYDTTAEYPCAVFTVDQEATV